MNIGFDSSLPFFELYEYEGETEHLPKLDLGGIALYALPSQKLKPRDKIPSHPLMTLNMEKEIVFYGGSFNPWHEGHQACIDLLPREKQLVVVLDRNPQKELTGVNPLVKWAEMMEKIQLRDEQAAREIYPGFLLKEEANPTIDWVKYLKRKYPKLPVSLLMGFDQLKNFQTWKQVHDLAPLLEKIYVASRLENESEFKQVQNELHQNLKVEVVSLGHHSFEEISSTKLRRS